jgi:hypothetical protein
MREYIVVWADKYGNGDKQEMYVKANNDVDAQTEAWRRLGHGRTDKYVIDVKIVPHVILG